MQIDVDAAEINKNVKVDNCIIGDVKTVLGQMLPKIEKKDNPNWLEKIEKLKIDYPLSYDMESLTGPSAVKAMYEITKGDAIICTDVGQHQMWASQYYLYDEPCRLITSGGLGTMGYGLGAAMGAKVGAPDKTVINVTGDGCFRMNLNELATVSRSNIPIIEVIMNNKVLGMVRQWQTLFYGQRYSSTVIDDKTDFVKVSEGFGVKAVRVSTLDQFKEAFAEAANSGEPRVIECMIEKDDKVFPMIPAGAANKDVFDESDMQNNEK